MTACMLVVALALGAAPAQASARSTPARPKLVVFDVHTTGIDPAQVPLLTEMLTAELARSKDYEVLSGADVAAIIGLEQQRQALGCQEESCLAELGGALGARKLVVTQVGKIGETFIINIKMVDTKEVRTDHRFSEMVKGDIDAALLKIKEIAGHLSKAAAERHRAEQAGVASVAPPREVAGSPADLAVTSSAPGRSVGVPELALWSTGGVALAAGVFFGLRAKGLESEVNDPGNDGAQLQVQDARAAQLYANVGYAVAVLGAGAGLALWLLRSPSAAPAGATLLPVVSPYGTALVGTFAW